MEGKLNESFHLLDNNSDLFNEESLILLGDTLPLTETLQNSSSNSSMNSQYELATYITDMQDTNNDYNKVIHASIYRQDVITPYLIYLLDSTVWMKLFLPRIILPYSVPLATLKCLSRDGKCLRLRRHIRRCVHMQSYLKRIFLPLTLRTILALLKLIAPVKKKHEKKLNALRRDWG